MSHLGQGPEAVLNRFLTQMAEWENSFYASQMELIEGGQPTAVCDAEYKHRLASILSACSLEDTKSWARLDGMGCTRPSMYDPDRDLLEVVGPVGKSWVATVKQAVGLRAVFRFELVETSGGWRIKKKETFRDDKWHKSTL